MRCSKATERVAGVAATSFALWNRAESYLANTHRLELGRIENPIALPVVDLAVFYEEKF